MTSSDRLSRFVRTKFRDAGKQYEEARRAFRLARVAAHSELPTDEEGRVKIVCRRYAERRPVHLDAESRPTCFEEGHTDCEGCLEDIREGRVETW